MSGLRPEAAPYRVGFDFACRALKKPKPLCLLQLSAPARERGLRDMQRLRCGPKAAEVRHRDKGAHIREIELHAWIVSISIFFAIYSEPCLADDSSQGAIRSGLCAPTTRDQPIMKISLCGALIAAMALPPLALAVAAPPTSPHLPTTIIVPFSAGGGTDSIARDMARNMADRLGQPVVIDN